MSEVPDKTAIADLMAVSGVGFGTSGARGLVDAMTDRVCYLYTLGFLQYLQQGAAIRPGAAVALAGELRQHSQPGAGLLCDR
jgi:phosphomannomutase